MNGPTLFGTHRVAPDTNSIISYMPVPGFGVLPVNSFVINAQEPVLIDTGLAGLRDDFLRELRDTIDPAELRWIWITHTDPDHLGNLSAVLEEAPNARVVTNYLGMGKMGLHQLPLDRVYLLNPGQELNVGDRKLNAVAPPCFDAPETVGLYDQKTQTLFSADCFGALLEKPFENAGEVNQQNLRDGCVTWSTVDAPWLHLVDPALFGKSLDAVRQLQPSRILSGHLPVAENMTETLLGFLAEAHQAPMFIGPDQKALEAMMAA